MLRVSLALMLVVGAIAWLAPSATNAAGSATTAVAPRSAVIGKRVLGHSVDGRPIVAWHLGQPGRKRVVVISTMHGNERATRRILTSLRDGRPIRGLDLWVIPVYNPDGLRANTRRNAHGVDLNRNYPYRWVDLDGNYESGPKAGSEPETQAMMAFLSEIRPSRVVSFHQPLNGVDVNTKRPRFAKRLATALRLPKVSLNCGGMCHGTMTMWFNATFPGAALTVEYPARIGHRRASVQAPRALIRVLGGRFAR